MVNHLNKLYFECHQSILSDLKWDYATLLLIIIFLILHFEIQTFLDVKYIKIFGISTLPLTPVLIFERKKKQKQRDVSVSKNC